MSVFIHIIYNGEMVMAETSLTGSLVTLHFHGRFCGRWQTKLHQVTLTWNQT